jgi:isopentenyldiphosphate isomerase
MGYSNDTPKPKEHEIEAWKWMRWDDFLIDIEAHPDIYSPWCKEEAMILKKKIILD